MGCHKEAVYSDVDHTGADECLKQKSLNIVSSNFMKNVHTVSKISKNIGRNEWSLSHIGQIHGSVKHEIS